MPNILIVDDEQVNLEFLQNLLQRHGYKVYTALSGSEAKAIVDEKSVDIVLLDIMLKDTSGLNVLKTLREYFSPAQLPVLMVTGLAEDENIEEALRLGANDYLVKPINPKVALARISRQIELKKSSEQTFHRAKQLEQAISSSQQGIWEHHLSTGELFVSTDGLQLLGFKEAESTDERWWAERVHQADRHLIEPRAFLGKNEQPYFEKEIRFLDKNNQYRWLLLMYRIEFSSNGHPLKQIGTFSDISQLKLKDKELSLPNELQMRTWLDAKLAVRKEIRKKRPRCFLIAIELDNFSRLKSLNSSSEVAEFEYHIFHLTNEVLHQHGVNAKVARLAENRIGILVSADEAFAFTFRRSHEKALIDYYTEQLRELAVVSLSFYVEIYPRIAYAIVGLWYQYSDALLDDVAITLAYLAQANQPFGRVTPKLREQASRTEKLRFALADAVNQQRFQLNYQPLICVENSKVVGAEALLRWRHEELGAISPAEFIPLAEQTGLILDIGYWVLRESFEQLTRWHNELNSNFFLSVNISARQLENQNLVQLLKELFQEFPKVKPKQLKLE
ncbi:MAG: EAL domain-containing protein, partial [Idiomarina sp.]|nr:EAL domain-containing protein [Idiomarina sp.]